jgi:hypothetical protein
MSKVKLDPLSVEQIQQPLPTERGLERDPRFPSQLHEDRAQYIRIVPHPAREQLDPLLVEGRNVRGPAMQVDRTNTTTVSFPLLSWPPRLSAKGRRTQKAASS